MTMLVDIMKANNVNDTLHQSLQSVAFGRGVGKVSPVVNQRNPCEYSQQSSQCRELNNCKTSQQPSQLKVGTWNVRTLLRPGKLTNVVREMKRADLNIFGLCETRWKDGGDFESEGVRVKYAGGKK